MSAIGCLTLHNTEMDNLKQRNKQPGLRKALSERCLVEYPYAALLKSAHPRDVLGRCPTTGNSVRTGPVVNTDQRGITLVSPHAFGNLPQRRSKAQRQIAADTRGASFSGQAGLCTAVCSHP